MPAMPRMKVTLFTTIGIAAYITLTYFLLNLPIFAKVMSFMRHVVSVKVTNDVYGFGTIMVDVRSLGKKIPGDTDLKLQHTPRKGMNLYRNDSKIRNKCFDTSLNGIETFETMKNMKKQTVSRKFQNLNTISKNFGEVDENRTCNSYITIDSPPGRSGNQMFQIAALLGTAYKLDLIPVIPKTFPLYEWFDLPNLMELNLTNAESFLAKPSGKYIQDINALSNENNWTLRGYFQSWKYFRNAEVIIKNAFRIKERYLNEAKNFIRNISNTGQVNVCVHVRRGDLSDSIAMRKGYTIAGIEFIYNAMNFYRRELKNVQFVILSDGIFWCMENIKGNDVIFSPFYRHAEDMALMTLCNHVVVTSGTFGWWGAWLSGGTTVYFSGYPRPDSWLASQINRHDYYPEDWIAL